MEVIDKIYIPLFPLDVVLFPDGVLPLRIFEPRYLDMVSDCMKSESGIGVILIKEGKEAGRAAKTYDTGTLSYISYWHKRNNGMLGITLTGKQRFRVLSTEVKANQLTVAEVELLPNTIISDIEHNEDLLIKLLKQIIAQLEPPYTTMTKCYDDMEWVSARLIELLPLQLKDKQQMLSMSELHERIDFLYPLLNSMKII